MKKILFAVFYVFCVHSTVCAAENAFFQTNILQIRELPYFETDQKTLLYDGGEKITKYEQIPAQGSKYLLVYLKVEKQGKSKASTDLNKLELMLEGKRFTRIDDSFLLNHNYDRLPGYKFSFGSKSGYVWSYSQKWCMRKRVSIKEAYSISG